MTDSSEAYASKWPNHLQRSPGTNGPGPWEGDISGIRVKWSTLARQRLADNAATYECSMAALKAATEHIAHSSAMSQLQQRVNITGSLHDHTTTTTQTTSHRRPDPCHISTVVYPSLAETHIYTDVAEVGFAKMQVTGHSVVQNGANERDKALSYGSLPPWRRRRWQNQNRMR